MASYGKGRTGFIDNNNDEVDDGDEDDEQLDEEGDALNPPVDNDINNNDNLQIHAAQLLNDKGEAIDAGKTVSLTDKTADALTPENMS